jgi:hypothetical protein
MRRTPSFFVEPDPEDFFDSPEGYLMRPKDHLGDYLENRRVLKALDDKLHFPELEGVIGNEDTLTSFYTFDGTRFMKDKVVNLFDKSEYSFPSMLANLYDCFVVKFNFPLSEEMNSFSERDLRSMLGNFVLEYKDFEEFAFLCELSDFVFNEVRGLHGNSFSELNNYRSDYPFGDVVSQKLMLSVRGFQAAYRSWRKHAEFYDFSSFVWGAKSHKLNSTSSKISRGMERSRACLKSDIPGTIVNNYVTRLSACMNLPDDKHAELNESELVDEWLILFDNFYPKYERLKAWYVKHKEEYKLGVLL